MLFLESKTLNHPLNTDARHALLQELQERNLVPLIRSHRLRTFEDVLLGVDRIGEMETATTYNLPVKVVVLNNNGDGMVKQWQKLFFKGRLSASEKTLHTKDFIKAAQADGFKYAVRLDRKEDVPRVIAEFLAFKGAAFLEVMIDPDAGVYPMVGPGQPYEAMITGDWIPSRKKVDVKPPGASEMF